MFDSQTVRLSNIECQIKYRHFKTALIYGTSFANGTSVDRILIPDNNMRLSSAVLNCFYMSKFNYISNRKLSKFRIQNENMEPALYVT